MGCRETSSGAPSPSSGVWKNQETRGGRAASSSGESARVRRTTVAVAEPSRPATKTLSTATVKSTSATRTGGLPIGILTIGGPGANMLRLPAPGHRPVGSEMWRRPDMWRRSEMYVAAVRNVAAVRIVIAGG